MGMNCFISRLCMQSIRKKSKLGNAGFWGCRRAWRALLPAASSGSLDLGNFGRFSPLPRGTLKGAVMLPNTVFYESKKYCECIPNMVCSLFKCQCHWENIPSISGIWFIRLNNCSKYTCSFSLNGKSSTVTED